LTLASVGPGAAQHIWFEMLKRAANIELIYVQYTGGAPAINALLGGHVTAVFAEYSSLAGIARYRDEPENADQALAGSAERRRSWILHLYVPTVALRR